MFSHLFLPASIAVDTAVAFVVLVAEGGAMAARSPRIEHFSRRPRRTAAALQNLNDIESAEKANDMSKQT